MLKKLNRRHLAIAALLGNVIIWGAALPIVKPSLNFMTSSQFLFLRYLIATPLMVPFVLRSYPKKKLITHSLTVVAVESLQIIGQLFLLYEGLKFTTALSSGFISNTAPIFITLGGILFLREREEKREWLGLVLSFVGSLLILIPSLSKNSAAGTFYGNSLVFLSTLSWTAYILIGKRHFHKLSKQYVTGLSCLLGLIFYTVVIVTSGHSFPTTLSLLQHPEVWKAVLYMGILGSPVAVSLLLYGHEHLEASEASLFTYLQPLIYIPLSIFWLGESLLPLEFTGLILISTGVLIAEKKK